jgi:predicted TIM-barrel fold metal-dependent hydrolase
MLVLLLMAAATPAAAQKPGLPPPRVDHHQHLLSPEGAALLAPAPLPAVELPPELARLLRRLEEGWNDKAALAQLFTEDSLVFTSEGPEWIRGRAAVAEDLSTRFSRAYRFTPVLYRTEGSGGHIAGYLTRGEGADARHFGNFYLGLDRDREGNWRVAAENLRFPGPEPEEAETGERLVDLLDAAGIQRAVVLSDAYWFDSPKYESGDPYPKVRAENDWTAQEAARYPDRLVAFCSFNPLKDYALAELDRCASSRRFKGVKLHFGMSRVDLDNPEQVAKVRRVAEAANKRRLALIIHVRPGPTYGRKEAEVFLSQIVAAAPDVPVQIAHLWGGEAFSDEALAVYADAVAAGDPRTKNLYFDLAEAAAVANGSAETLQTIAKRIRQIGLQRVLYGSDGPVPEADAPRDAWRQMRTEIPLTETELRTIANNVAPYLR